ncbi:MAG: 30S ribosomal protein S4 [Planctomycetota bacterium]
MARYTGPKCKRCRREGVKLFLKGTRCHTAKCPIDKRSRPPGMHGYSRGRPSPYAIRLRETQKVKRFYGLLEKQFRRVFSNASQQQGNTGENLLALLERRLDNVVTIAGLAASRAQGRQFTTHGHIEVNGQKLRTPSYEVKEGDVIRPKPQDNILALTRTNREEQGHPEPSWLDVNDADLTVEVARMPIREDVSLEVDDGLVVEYCSR